MTCFDAAVWGKHRVDAYRAIMAMLSQYRDENWDDIEGTALQLVNEPDLLPTLVEPSDGAIDTLSELSGKRLEWFRALQTLAELCGVHLTSCLEPEDDLSHGFMTAGEWATCELTRYGFLERTFTGGCWTDAGRKLLAGAFPD